MKADNSDFAAAWDEANKPAETKVAQLGGMAGKAESDLKGRAYQLHVQEAKASGETPKSPEEFAKGGK
jgi:hypothetical protein